MKNIQLPLLILSFLLFIFSSFAYAAGFDCKRASSRAEKLICHDEYLSDRDEELNQTYQKAFADPLIDRPSLKAYVKQFIKSRNSCMRDATDPKQCMDDHYQAALHAYRSFPHSVDVDTFELNQTIAREWDKIAIPIAEETWPYRIYIFMPGDANGLFHESEAYLVIDDRVTEITRQVIYLPNLFLDLDDSSESTAHVDYNGGGHEAYARIDNPDSDGSLSITLSCGDYPRYTYHYMHFVADKATGEFIFKKEDDCGATH